MIIGIDPSLVSTGYCTIDRHRRVLDQGRIETKKLRGPERLKYIKEELTHILYRFDNIDFVCIEDYSFGSQGRAVFQIGELGGVIRVLLYESIIPYIEIAPTCLKKFVTGKGNSKKDEVMLHVFKRWGFEAKNSDEADAYALAQMGIAIATGDHGLTQAQAEALEKPRRAFELLMCEKEELNV